MSDPAQVLKDMKPTKKFFIGIDSDGCVFDTMEIKHKECFAPMIIKHWGLQAVSKYGREACEFVNLYSVHRGINRWPALIKVLDLVRERPEVIKRNVNVPQLPAIRKWIETESKLSNSSLKSKAKETGDAEFTKALAWSEAVNAQIEDIVYGVPPFPFVRESFERAAAKADLLCVSQTPVEALEREWKEHGVDRFARAIAGQEMGTKAQHLEYAAGGDKYPRERVLMIGDAPGDQSAARKNKALFFPILPGREEESWERFHREALDRFLAGTYAGTYETERAAEFAKCLPESPPWRSLATARR